MATKGIRLSGLEIWTDLECNGGTRVAFFAPLPSSAIRTRQVNGASTLKVTLRRDADAWDEIVKDRVLRAVMTDGSYDEWRITKPSDSHQKDGRKLAEVECEDPFYDLGHRIVYRTEANQDAYADFDLYGLSAADHLAVILASAQSYFSAGTVEFGSAIKVDLAYRAFSPLDALRKLCAALPGGGELEVTRNGTSGYLVHLSAAVGSSAPKVYFRYGKNLDAVQRRIDGTGQPTRVFPLGQDVEGRRFDMADAAWEISAIAGTTITLLGSPIAFDDQLNGLYLQPETGGTPTLINDTVLSTQQVVVASAAGLSVGQKVNVRRTASGAELLYLERPGATHVRAEVLERPDIPPTDNLVKNPFLSNWSGGLPVNWSKVGLPTVSQITDPVNHRWGDASAQVVCLAEEEGLETDWIPVDPTDEQPFFGAQISLFVAEGVVRFEIVAQDAGAVNTYVIPDDTVTGGRAYTSVIGQWIDRLAIQDQATNFKELGVVQAKLRIVADRLDGTSGQTSFYLDAAQLCRTSLPDLPFYDGRASCALWAAANAELLKWANPPTELTIDLVDLYRVAPGSFPHDGLVLGGTVRIDDATLDLSYENRIVKLTEELVQEGATQVELSQKPEELTDLTTEDQLSERRSGTLNPRGASGDVDGDPRLDEDYTQLYLFPGSFPAARSVRWVSSATPIVDADVLASPNVSDDPQILVHTFTSDREQRWVGLAYYPASGGAGKVGRIHILPPWTFFTRDNRPTLDWQTFPTQRPSVVRIGLTVVDDGDQVALYYRSYTSGDTPPAYTRSPVGGFVSDPYEVSVDVTRPASDSDPDVILEAYGVDDQANESLLIRLHVKHSMVLQEDPRIFPELDEDGDDLYLVWEPNSGAERVQWLVDNVDDPTLPEVQASANFDATGKVLVYTFDPNGPKTQQVFLGYIPQSQADGGSVRDSGPLVVIPFTYRRGNDRPRIVHSEEDPGSGGVERVRITALDDGDQVALYVRDYDKGGSVPAYTRIPAVGYLSDPLTHVVEFSKPAEGAANRVIEAYAEDDTSPTPLQSDPLYLESDGDDVPTGWLEGPTPDAGTIPQFIVNTDDTDSGSWRLRAAKGTDATTTFPSLPAGGPYNDSATDEFKGNTFGDLESFGASQQLDEGEVLMVSLRLFRTTTATAAAQANSIASEELHFRIRPGGSSSPNVIRVVSSSWRAVGAGSTFPAGLWALYDMSLAPGSAVQSMHVQFRDVTDPMAPGAWLEYDFDISAPELHTLRDSADPTTERNCVVDSTFEIWITPYDAPGGAAGAGSPGVTTKFFTGVARDSLTGTSFEDAEGTQTSTDVVKSASRSMWIGTDAITGRAKIGAFLDATTFGVDFAAGTAADNATAMQAAVDKAHDLGGGLITCCGLGDLGPVKMRKGVFIMGDGWGSQLTLPANSHTVDDSGTTTAGSSANTLNDTSKAWTVNEHQWKTVYLPATGQRRIVVSNTATQLVIGMESGVGTEDWTSVPGAGVAYQILNPVPMFSSYSEDDNGQWGVRCIKLVGNKANQLAFVPAIHVRGQAVEFADSLQHFVDVLIKDFGYGVWKGGGGNCREVDFDHVVIRSCERHGIFTEPSGGTDSSFRGVMVGGCGLTNIVANGSNDRWQGCKSFGAGANGVTNQRDGWLVMGKQNISGCDAQENPERGFHLYDADGSRVTGRASSNGSAGVHFWSTKYAKVDITAFGDEGLAYAQPWAVSCAGMASPTDRSESNTIDVVADNTHSSGAVQPDLEGYDNDIRANDRRQGRVFSAYGEDADSTEHFTFGKRGAPSATEPQFALKIDAGLPKIGGFEAYDGTNIRRFFQYEFATTGIGARLRLGASSPRVDVNVVGALIMGTPNSDDPRSKGLGDGEIALQTNKYIYHERTFDNTLRVLIGWEEAIGRVWIAKNGSTTKFGAGGEFQAVVQVTTTGEGLRVQKTGAPAAGNPYFTFKHNNGSPPTFSLETWDGTSARVYAEFDPSNVEFRIGSSDNVIARLPTFSDATRPSAGRAGRIFYSSTDGKLNIDNGANWTLPDGTVT